MQEEIKILNQGEIEEELNNLPGWRQKDNKIYKEFEFKSFLGAMSFIKNLSSFFEENDHHPDINWSYKKIKFELTRYDIGGKLTNKDFMTAREIEKRYNE